METVHKKLQLPESNSFSTNAEEKSELPTNVLSCDAPIEEKVKAVFSYVPLTFTNKSFVGQA